MDKTAYLSSFEQNPALKNTLNNYSSQILSNNVPTLLISVASKIYQLFAPLRTVDYISDAKSDEILFADKPNLLESPLQLLLREIRNHFRLVGEPTLSIPSMSLRISAALTCIEELTPLHLLVLHQQSTQEPLVLIVEDEQRVFDERWSALLQQSKVLDHAPVSVSVLLDNSVDDVVSNAAVVSTEQRATEEDDEEVDLDIDSPPTSVREEHVPQPSIDDAEIHSEVLVGTNVESQHEVSTSSVKVEESFVTPATSATAQEPFDEELDDVDVADVSAGVTNNSGNEMHVGQKRNREEEDAIIDGEPEAKRPKLEIETVTTTTVTETVAVDMIQVE